MRDVSSGTLGVLAVLVLVGSILGAAAFGVAAGAQSTESTDYELSELRQGGQQVAGGAPSYRWVESDVSMYVDRRHTNPLKSGGGEDWQVEKLLRPGETVNTNTVRFHYQGPRGTSNRTYTVHVVYWQEGTREVERNGSTVERTVAVNQTHETHELTFGGAFDTTELDLRGHYDEPVRVTMWVDESPDVARWTFQHKSLETAQTVTTQTAGDRLWWLVSNYVLWIVAFGLVGASISLWAIRRAGAGPQMGVASWAFLIGIGGFFAIMWNYEGIATLFARGPKILAATTVALLMIPWVEGQDDRLRKNLFVRPVVTEAVSASGQEARDALYLEIAEKKVTELPDGTLSVVKPGPIKFLARVLGGAAPLQGARDMGKTEVRAEGSTRHDRVVWITPDADEIVDYAPETISLHRPPELSLKIGGIALTLLVINASWIGASVLSWLAYAGLGFTVLTALEVRSGYAKIEPATAHERSAHVTTMVASKEMDDAQTLDEARRETYKERAKSSKDVEEVVEVRDDTLIKEMLGVEVDASVRSADSGDGERDHADVATDAVDTDDREARADD
mgnify:CR=1 FL=1